RRGQGHHRAQHRDERGRLTRDFASRAMKYVWMMILGWVVGAVAAAALIFFNPLIASGDARLAGFDQMLQYALPADAVVLTHGGALPIERRPFEAEPLWESTIRSSALATLILRSEAGEPQAVASRIA